MGLCVRKSPRCVALALHEQRDGLLLAARIEFGVVVSGCVRCTRVIGCCGLGRVCVRERVCVLGTLPFLADPRAPSTKVPLGASTPAPRKACGPARVFLSSRVTEGCRIGGSVRVLV